YDEDRVHVSDMKKLFAWYNILIGAGFTSFVEAEQADDESGAPVISTAPEVAKPKNKVQNTNVHTNSKAKSTTRVRAVKASS
ncbi:MAG: hypothetical protein RR388_08800, partial [Rikenellaceae bacterium]